MILKEYFILYFESIGSIAFLHFFRFTIFNMVILKYSVTTIVLTNSIFNFTTTIIIISAIILYCFNFDYLLLISILHYFLRHF